MKPKMKPIDVLTKSFSALNDVELKRLEKYADSEKKFLCGEDCGLYCKDGRG